MRPCTGESFCWYQDLSANDQDSLDAYQNVKHNYSVSSYCMLFVLRIKLGSSKGQHKEKTT